MSKENKLKMVAKAVIKQKCDLFLSDRKNANNVVEILSSLEVIQISYTLLYLMFSCAFTIPTGYTY